MTYAYTLTDVFTDVYCSSTGHYGVDVRISYRGHNRKRSYDFNGGFWLPQAYIPATMPKYIERAVDERLRELYTAGKLRFYECDRDGNRRYDDLRYHDPRAFEWQIGLHHA